MADEATAESDNYTTHGETVIKAERKLLGLADTEPVAALAISGGGIRSASFALGVMQALVRGGALSKVHYLSTVSGGGYIGSSLTWFLRQGLGTGKPAGMTEADFPFGAAQRQHSFDGAAKRNELLDYIRQHGAYLTPTPGLNLSSFVAVVLRAMSVSLTVYFALLTGLTWGLKKLGLFAPPPPALQPAFGFAPNAMLLAALLLAVGFVFASVLFAVLTRFAGQGEYRRRIAVQKLFGLWLRASGACALLGTLPIVHHDLGRWLHLAWGALTASGAAAGVLEFITRQSPKEEDAGSDSTARPMVAILLVLYGLALGAYSLATMFSDGTSELGEPLFVGAVALAAVIGLLANINYLGLHRMYRDRLMELFLPDRAAVDSGSWGQATEADRACIDGFCGAPKYDANKPGGAVGPYHLVNTNIVLVDSKVASYRGRGGDNFILSPLYCGSDATGWSRSSGYMKSKPGAAEAGMTLPTAMAISGAAVNPNAGVSGRGLTRGRAASTLLALLNLRLGYWAPHPRHCRDGSRPRIPNFIDPGLRGGVLSGGLHEDAPLVELTDGGHFENLAVYELIRRRVSTIFLCDGGQDGKLKFDDLANLIERVRVDFGAKLSFDVPGYGLDQLKPGSAEAGQGAPLPVQQLATRGFAIGRIRYAGDSEPSGRLFYWKGTITPALSVDLYGYKNANPEFPHQSTADQFFDEDQFEAYRELGYYLGWQWLEDKSPEGFRAARDATSTKAAALSDSDTRELGSTAAAE